MPETPVVYDDVVVLEEDGLGFTVRIGSERAFIGKYVKLPGSTVQRAGDRGRLVLPRWFVEQQALPLDRHMNDQQVEEWLALAKLRAATAQEHLDRSPGNPEAQAALERATTELAAALALNARRQNKR